MKHIIISIYLWWNTSYSVFTPDETYLNQYLPLIKHTLISIYPSMPTGFFIWGYMYPFTFIFGGAMYPLTLHLGVQRKWTAFSPRKVVHSVFFMSWTLDCPSCTELAKTFFSVWHWVRQELGFCVPLCLSHHFFVILYITCHILFLYRTECKITYSHDH